MMRIMVIVLYTPLIFFQATDREDAKEFIYSIADWPTSRYFFFFAPLGISLIDVYLIRLGKKSGIPMPKVSRNFIYASWLVSLVLYSLFLFALLT